MVKCIGPLLSVFCGVGLAASAQTGDMLKIGFMTTLSGPAASIGTDLRDGMRLAVDLPLQQWPSRRGQCEAHQRKAEPNMSTLVTVSKATASYPGESL